MDVLTLPRLALAVALATAAACSLTYDWDPDGQPCRQSGAGATASFECDEGFSCYQRAGVAVTECVRDGSRRRGEGCSLDSMCEEPLQCVDGACRESCGANYFSPTACRGDEFCKPFPNETIGFCTRSECLNETCPTGNICAEIKDGAGACLIECTPSFTDQSYSDNCGSTGGENYCQAVGRGAQRRLVCLDTSRNGQPIGTFCNVIDQPCAANQTYTDGAGQVRVFGLTCATSQCVELCDPTLPNPGSNTTDCGASTARGATYCCEQIGARDAGGNPTRWGICIPFGGSSTCDPELY
ncbi:MAG: hypothetical protein ACAI38_22625 [Myxococcota bacterium]|nr:hypothetical protein [Myxococcota bacterium]